MINGELNSRGECPYVREGRFSEPALTMNRRLTFLLTVATGAICLPGCYYDNEEYLYPDTFCDTSAVTWSGTIEPLIQSSCAIPGCHVPGAESPTLTSYTAVKAIADDGRMRGVLILGTPAFMPLNGKLPACDQTKVQVWLDAGAPEN